MLKDYLIFVGLMMLSIVLALILTGCTQKSTNANLICKYWDIDCQNVKGYKDQKACYVNQKLKEEFCK